MIKAIAVKIIRFYQLFISPLKRPCCRFTPTCSEFACQAIQHFGITRGTFLAFWRLVRCHPFHPGGYDPIDKYFTMKKQPPR